ncbi:MAG: hypothetical protein Q9221_007940 [Calogaya cf. arnoldii]
MKTLGDQFGAIALGINNTVPGVLEYWPGHLVRILEKGIDNEISDGLLILRHPDGKAKIMVLIEMKSGNRDNIINLAREKFSKKDDPKLESKSRHRNKVTELTPQQLLDVKEDWVTEYKLAHGRFFGQCKYSNLQNLIIWQYRLKTEPPALSLVNKSVRRLQEEAKITLNGQQVAIEIDRATVQLLAIVRSKENLKSIEDILKLSHLTPKWRVLEYTNEGLIKACEYIREVYEANRELLAKVFAKEP